MQMQQMLLGTDPSGYAAACRAVREIDLRDCVSSISTPTCILAGEHDALATVDDARFLQQQIAGSSLVPLSAAHISNMEAAADFTSAVLEFLREQDSREHGKSDGQSATW